MKREQSKVFQVVYISSAKVKPTQDEIKKILEVARAKNKVNDMTGLLMARGNMFVQLLEGPRPAVQETLKRISGDKRHSNLKILLEGVADFRIFETWSMGYFDDASSATSTAQIMDAVDRFAQEPGELRSTILKILKACNSQDLSAKAG